MKDLLHEQVCLKNWMTVNSDSGEGLQPAAGYKKILDAAVRLLETDGEAALRMTAIAREAGVSLALITRHFGSRDGLVAAAQQVRFAGAVATDLAAIDAALKNVVNMDELRERIAAIVWAVVAEARGPIRLGRVAALASAHGRDESHEALGATIGDLLTEMTRLITRGQQLGLFRADVNARALATFLQAYPVGLVLADLDPDRVETADLHRVITLAIETFLPAQQ